MNTQPTELTAGVTGAKRQSWERSNPRELLKRIMTREPDATMAEIANEFWEEARKNAELLHTIVVKYWVPNNYRSAQPISSEEAAIRTKARSTIAEDVKAKVEMAIKEKAKIILLDMVLPNGKKVRDTTGTECMQIAPQFGDWLFRIGQIAGRSKIGSVLTEERLKAIYES